MRALLQRVSRAEVRVDGESVGRIGAGFLVLLGVADGDSDDDAALLLDKTLGLRVFPDDEGRMNRSVVDTGGALLVVSQFTLHADCRRGRRPAFTRSAPPAEAERLYDVFVERAREAGRPVETGRFGAMMDVELVNDGPVTILLDTDDLKRPRRESGGG